MLEKCVLTVLELNWNKSLGQKKTKLNICLHMLTSSTQLQNKSFHVVERTRTSSKCQKMKYARAKRAKILFSIVKYANLWGFCCRRRRGCLSSLMWSVRRRLCRVHAPDTCVVTNTIPGNREASWATRPIEDWLVDKQFSVFKKRRSKFDCLIFEMLSIKDLNHKLNTQKDSIRTKLFTWLRVIFYHYHFIFSLFILVSEEFFYMYIRYHFTHFWLDNDVKRTSKRRVILNLQPRWFWIFECDEHLRNFFTLCFIYLCVSWLERLKSRYQKSGEKWRNGNLHMKTWRNH